MKLFEVGYGIAIREVESERQTDKSVYINGSRHAWRSYWSSYFLTRSAAKDYLLENARKDFEIKENQCLQAWNRLSSIMLL